MKEPKFISKFAPIGIHPLVEFSDLERIKTYQLELINTIVYDTPRFKSGGVDNYNLAKLYAEIQRCEVWLKKQWIIVMNDKNRKILE